ncbi:MULTISPECIES: hypothetical protein [unclassified Sphingomonas]|uniref:hypothetical protein n=1 Tax=unclassified Sphingomonas TaxID=196159 RepID=UPI0006FD5A38|nr:MULTISPECIES: hypothetical protein [unclassified Sphingomonas]KQM61916.1 hypothetical protein ASE65_06905 [Sphingomonas sp. Leaf16]KQN13189.1 hypothetical protein ASE81_07920 [Sphingomonas sp. Leaf29]KQN20074.1 hypothetical protein ASE83_07845 [Sphingomonas sp. Leaf32]
MTVSTPAAIRGEQLRLVLAGIGQSFPVAFLLSSLLVVVLDRVAPLGELLAWYVAFLALRVATVGYARRMQRQRSTPAQGRTTERVLMMLKIAEGGCSR